MAIIGIISIGVYNSYLLLIRNTKEGQVKQSAALEGKNIIESIKQTSEDGSLSILDGRLLLGDIKMKSLLNIDSDYGRYLDGNFNVVDNKEEAKYIEKITINKTKAKINGNTIDINSGGGNGNSNSDSSESTLEAKFNIEKPKNSDYIKIYDEDNNYNEGTTKLYEDNLLLNIYESYDKDNEKEIVVIKDTNGNEIVKKTFDNIDKDEHKNRILKVTVNFKNYNEDDGKEETNSNTSNIKLLIYNQDKDNSLNLILEKKSQLNVNTKVITGQVNIFNNRSEDETAIGALHDFKVEIEDINGKKLFTGYSNENVKLD